VLADVFDIVLDASDAARLVASVEASGR